MSPLLITPADDGIAKRVARWAERLQKQFPLLDRREARARSEIDALLSARRDLLYFGHGKPDALVASPGRFQGKQPLIDSFNLPTQPGRVVIAIACWSGEKLGSAVTEAAGSATPVAAYLGWLDEVGWPPGLAEPIEEAVLEGLSPLLEGGSIDDCRAALEAAFERAHDRYRAQSGIRLSAIQAHFGKMHAIYWRARLVTHGDGSAQFDLTE